MNKKVLHKEMIYEQVQYKIPTTNTMKKMYEYPIEVEFVVITSNRTGKEHFYAKARFFIPSKNCFYEETQDATSKKELNEIYRGFRKNYPTIQKVNTYKAAPIIYRFEYNN